MDTLPLFDPSWPPSAFDYQAMDPNAARDARAAVERYRSRQKAYVIDTGRDLLAIKAQLEHGLFLEWVQSEIGMTPRSAQRAMAAAEVLGDKSDTVSYLPPTVLYELSAPSTPEPVRTAVLRRIEAGEAVRAETILDEVREGRDEARKQVAAEREKARRAAMTPEQRDNEDALRARGRKRDDAWARKRERERLQARKEREANDARARIGANYLLSRLGADEIDAFFEQFDASARYRAFDLVQRMAQAERARSVEPVDLPLDKVLGTSSFEFLDPEDKEQAEGLARQFEAGAPFEPVIVVDAGNRKGLLYRIVEGEDRYHALRGVLGRETIPTRIVPPTDPAAVAAIGGDDGRS